MNPEGILPLLVGAVLAIIALTFVLWPLVTESRARSSPPRNPAATAAGDEEQAGAIAALREIEFDHATGKLSDADYADMRQRYTRAALDELREVEAAAAPVPTPPVAATAPDARAPDARPPDIDDAVEAAIARARAALRSCDACGPRPETDATYCSECGRPLPVTPA